MTAGKLIPGRIYLVGGDLPEFAEFSRIGGTDLAIFHPPGEPDMQSSWAIDPKFVVREATPEEIQRFI